MSIYICKISWNCQFAGAVFRATPSVQKLGTLLHLQFSALLEKMLWIHVTLIAFLAVHVCLGADFVELAKDAAKAADDEMTKLKQTLSSMSRQMMLQQFFSEERIRSEGSSGLKQIRLQRMGNKNYYSETHIGGATAAIHNHANNIRTVGMGEFVAVLNGVEFRTRHNDYRLYMPSTKSKDWHKVEEIPFPDVPKAVLNKETVDGQIEEMREWFKAWRDQDHSKRDYRKHFKPILCYLEGAWTTSGKKVDEPFDSDRHFIDAKSWQELHDRIRFTSYSGSKSRLENLAFLPTTVMGFINDTIPIFAQWNYRILCHPLKQHVPLAKLKIVEDLSSRMTFRRTIGKHKFSRGARFIVDSDLDPNKTSDVLKGNRLFIDKLMEEIPGKDNYPGKLFDKGLDGTDPAMKMDDSDLMDVSRYHRWFKVGRRDAMGLQGVHRGFSDEGMFAAMTTQQRVVGLDIENRRKCKWDRVLRKRVCPKMHQKWTWAIPLEIIYLTPLSKWNPFNLTYRGDARREGKTATEGGRNGNCKDTKFYYNGTNSKAYFLTPAAFYSGATVSRDAADTTRGAVCVLGPNGEKRHVMASGTHVLLPPIKNVGTLRQRYPIMPIHGEGSSVWKELNAVRDMVLNPTVYEHMRWDSNVEANADLELITGFSLSSSPGVTPHTHTVYLSPKEVEQLHAGLSLVKTTSIASGHSHDMTIIYDSKRKVYRYVRCGTVRMCRDRHGYYFSLAEDN